MDRVDRATRSRMMSSVRAKNTKGEVGIRKRLFARGFRYRVHRNGLPGTPDLVLRRHNAVVFINGCFWHQHGCGRSKLPETRRNWWKAKLEENKERDRRVCSELRDLGWRVALVWECAYRSPGLSTSTALDSVADRLAGFLQSNRQTIEISGQGDDHDQG